MPAHIRAPPPGQMSTAASVARRGETELLRTQVNVSAAATGRKSEVEALVLARALAADDELLAVISSAFERLTERVRSLDALCARLSRNSGLPCGRPLAQADDGVSCAPRSVHSVLAAVGDPNTETRAAATLLLGRLPPKVLSAHADALIAHISSGDEQASRDALYTAD